MKITALIENTACNESLCTEHGLSLYIEANGKKIAMKKNKEIVLAAGSVIHFFSGGRDEKKD